jgi:hypothetical protein
MIESPSPLRGSRVTGSYHHSLQTRWAAGPAINEAPATGVIPPVLSEDSLWENSVEVNIAIMRTFVQLRRLMDSNRDLARKIEAMEKKCDEQFAVVFDAMNNGSPRTKRNDRVDPRLAFIHDLTCRDAPQNRVSNPSKMLHELEQSWLSRRIAQYVLLNLRCDPNLRHLVPCPPCPPCEPFLLLAIAQG